MQPFVPVRSIVAVTLACTLSSSLEAQSRVPLTDLPMSMREVLGVRLNRDSLASVQARLGPSPVRTTGDGHDAELTVCYRVQAGAHDAIVTFVSDGEMGGPGHELDEIRVTRTERAPSGAAQCATAVPLAGGLSAGALRLGMSRAEVRRVLGVPETQNGDTVVYRWESEDALPPTDPYYDHWNKRRQECFGGRAPYLYVSAGVRVRFDARGSYEYVVWRADNGIC